MSRLSIDQLFKTKLKNLERTPSPEAWGKLEALMAQNKKRVLYIRLRVAASISIVLMAGWVIWSAQRSGLGTELNTQLAQSETQSAEIKPIAPVKETTSAAETNRASEKKPSKVESIPNESIARKTKKTSTSVVEISNEKVPSPKEEIKQLSAETMLAQVNETPVDQELMKQVKETLPPVMIIYKSALSESETLATVDHTSEKLTWDAVVAVARDFKEGNLSLGSKIKEAKEDLFNIRLRNKDNSK